MFGKLIYLCMYVLYPWEDRFTDPVRAAVHLSSRVATSAGFGQRETGSKVVGRCGQSKRWRVLCSATPHRGQFGEGWLVGYSFLQSVPGGECAPAPIAGSL